MEQKSIPRVTTRRHHRSPPVYKFVPLFSLFLSLLVFIFLLEKMEFLIVFGVFFGFFHLDISFSSVISKWQGFADFLAFNLKANSKSFTQVSFLWLVFLFVAYVIQLISCVFIASTISTITLALPGFVVFLSSPIWCCGLCGFSLLPGCFSFVLTYPYLYTKDHVYLCFLFLS